MRIKTEYEKMIENLLGIHQDHILMEVILKLKFELR